MSIKKFIATKQLKTMFKKGNKPHNTKQIGDEVIDVDGYTLVKVEVAMMIKQDFVGTGFLRNINPKLGHKE